MTDQPPAAPAPTGEQVVDAVAAETDLDLRPPVSGARVGGGYSWRTYVLTAGDDRRVVVRAAPPGGTMSPYDPRVEAAALQAAAGAVPAPAVLAVVPTPNRLGAAYGVHSHADGEVRRLSSVPAEARTPYRTAFATALGRLHARSDAAALDPGAAAGTTAEALHRDLEATAAAIARSAPCRHPGLVVGLRWLRTHVPPVDDPPRLCHGDFRFHNLAWAGEQVAAVLDWERAWAGDPMVDVAFTRRFSGWCAVDDDAVAAYETASGLAVDERRVAYGMRYEWVRSTTSATRGWHALAAGRDDALDLYAIGEAGWAGAWAMVELLAEGALAPAVADDLDVHPHAPFTPARLAELTALADAAGRADLAAHLRAADDADARATADSVALLRALAPGSALADPLGAALAHPDDAVAWGRAHAVLAEAATTGGVELLAPLRALGRRHTGRTTLLPLATPPPAPAAVHTPAPTPPPTRIVP